MRYHILTFNCMMKIVYDKIPICATMTIEKNSDYVFFPPHFYIGENLMESEMIQMELRCYTAPTSRIVK